MDPERIEELINAALDGEDIPADEEQLSARRPMTRPLESSTPQSASRMGCLKRRSPAA